MNRTTVAVMLAVVMRGAEVFGMQAGQGPALQVVEGRDFSVAVRGGVTFQSGEARELVYEGAHKLSELVWDISGLALAGGTVSATVGASLQLNGGLWLAVSKGNGSMTDFDWFVPGLDWTHFSDGDVDINSAYMFDINGAWTFHRADRYSFFGILGYKRLFWDWSEYGRSYIYSSEDGFRDLRGRSDGVNGIDYEQTFDIPYAGLGVRYSSGALCGSLYALYSPLAKAEDKDHHILRGLRFEESFKNIDYFALGGEVSANLTESFFLSAAVDMHTIPDARGDMKVTNEFGETYFIPDSAGIGNTVVALTLAAGLRL